MREFTDTKGRVWKLDVTVAAVKRVREATTVLLPSLFDDSFAGLAGLAADYIKLVDVLWAMCAPQAASMQWTIPPINPGDEPQAVVGVNPEQFAEGLGGDALGKATEALARAVADFFTSREQRDAIHSALGMILETSGKVTTLTTQKATEAIASLDTDQLALSCLDFVTSGQAKQELTQTPEQLVNYP